MYSGYEISDTSRKRLLDRFGTSFPDFIGHHVTYKFGKGAEDVPPTADVYILGKCVGDNIECFIVEVNGSIVRPDGKIYHLTWSLDKSKGAKPVHSNDAIEKYGFEHFDGPIKIEATPKTFK